nr:PREDICTED: uncharacterized protein LOC109031933 [Bemisia tabaci]
MAARERLISEIFTDATRAGGFGDDVEKFVSFKSANDKAGNAQYASAVEFGEITLEKKNSELDVQPVFIKTQIRAVYLSPPTSDDMFHNEVLFFTKIVPLLRKHDTCNVLSTSFPELVYGKAVGNSEEDIVVLKDLRQKGFQPCVHRERLDERHIELVLDRLGKFHALSFTCRLEDPMGFEEVASQMRELDHAKTATAFGGFVSKEDFREGLFRGIRPLQKETEYQGRLAALEANCTNAYDLFEKYVYGSRDSGVIVHGDFRLDNMMFKYEADGTPIEVVFFDFQTICIGSPALDICRFMIFEVPTDLRHARWETFLCVYHDALANQMRGHQNRIPSIETVELDIRKKGIFAYYIYALCWPNLFSNGNGLDLISVPKLEGLNEEELQKAMETHMQNVRGWGGPKVTEMLAEVVRFMIDKNFIFEY